MMNWIRQSLKISGHTFLFLLLILFSLFLNIYNNDFPLGYHPDERKKIEYVKNTQQDFSHPLLMREAVRKANLIFKFTDRFHIAILGRTVTAVFGTLIILLAYLLTRRITNRTSALIVAFSIAVSPIMVIHSHYFKEDIMFTFFTLLCVWALINYIERTDKITITLLGITTGLAISTHYKGFILLGFYSIVPFIIKFINKSNYYKHLLIAFLISTAVFIFINYSSISHWDLFAKQFIGQLHHSLKGHQGIKIYPLPYFFSFHILNSLMPGITLLLALFALYYVIYMICRWAKTKWQEKIFLTYVLLSYFSAEISPLKPYPDFMRYIIPLVPLIIFFSYQGLEHLTFSLKLPKIIIYLIIGIFLILPLQASLRLVYYLNKDTRAKAEQWIKNQEKQVICESYVLRYMARSRRSLEPLPKSKFNIVNALPKLDRKPELRKKAAYLLASSFSYDRYYLGSKLKHQRPGVYKFHKKYESLFRYPYVEIKPAYKSFAFSNPTIRIIDVSKNLSHNEANSL